MNFTILGGGSWGTAISLMLNRNGNKVKIWEFNQDFAKEMQEERVCKLLSEEIKIPEGIFISSSIEEALKDSEAVIVVVPSVFVESTIQSAKQYLTDQKIIICSKGFSKDTQLLSECISKQISNDIFCLYGPNIAKEVATGVTSAGILAGKNADQKLFDAINSRSYKLETSDDIIGVQVGGALKNVVTIAVGIVEGAGLGDNTKAFVFTKGLDEISQIGVAMGAKKETFFGLSCMGDLTLKSRNRELGILIGSGEDVQKAIHEGEHVKEGIVAIQHAIKLADKYNLDLKIIRRLNAVINGEVKAQEFCEGL